MRIRLLCVGKLRERYTRAAADDFIKRLRLYHAVDEVEIKSALGTDPRHAIAAESAALLERIMPVERVWLLDREGIQLSSDDLASSLREDEVAGYSRLTFVIGGAYGVNQDVRQRANVRWSLSRLTFLHEWSRLLVIEQLYRASKIIRNEPYHH